jgi:hypothetical protein
MNMAVFWDVALCRLVELYIYIPYALTNINVAFCNYVLHMILSLNSDYFLEQL